MLISNPRIATWFSCIAILTPLDALIAIISRAGMTRARSLLLSKRSYRVLNARRESKNDEEEEREQTFTLNICDSTLFSTTILTIL